MQYYTIQNNSLLTADNIEALTRFYDNVMPLPSDYEPEKYIIVDNELVLNPDYPEIALRKAKEAKYQECLDKAYYFQQNGIVEYKNCEFEMSDSNRKNLSDTEEALRLMGQESTIWNDKEDNLVELTINDIQYIRLNLILARIQKLWIEQYPTYKQEINEAQTVEEVNAIIIDYESEEV